MEKGGSFPHLVLNYQRSHSCFSNPFYLQPCSSSAFMKQAANSKPRATASVSVISFYPIRLQGSLLAKNLFLNINKQKNFFTKAFLKREKKRIAQYSYTPKEPAENLQQASFSLHPKLSFIK